MSSRYAAGAAPAATYDAVVVGGGHNGLVAAAYLAKAGRRVRVLERLDHVGGAAVSAHAFEGVDARLSRYSYLVSLLPRRIVDDLGARVRLVRRRYSSYTPDPATGGRTGLLIGPTSTFGAIGAADDGPRFAEFYGRCGVLVEQIWPTLLEPLLTRSQARDLVDDEAAWRSMVDEPIGHAISSAVDNDVVRGVMATDALIGTFARLDDASLIQNVCFLYHLLGGGTGDWDVPIGGMGAITGALAAAATGYGAEITCGTEVYAIDPAGEVRYHCDGIDHTVHGRVVLANVTPTVLAGLLGEQLPESTPGAQVKVNLILRRLPRLRDQTVTPEQAFGGTFHINETFSQLDSAYLRAVDGAVPDPLPCEIYCHSLTDPSILSDELRAAGAQTLTVFGLHTPHHLVSSGDPDRMRDTLTSAVLSSLNSVLAEPIHDVLMEDSAGRLCIEAKTTVDLEHSLGMTGGHIFHGGLAWPFAENDEPLDTPARRWGVATAHDRILLCGSGSRRGGGVSGIGGHNAAMAVLES
ncbi:NAD(P)/FAD-dependent oxidoreductase [Mycolicibacterium novocastrense]|uniref:NAD(P)/FAD-dependent oxidoreductase n=1 Tax=Mycolicibacterium novocastrense TaxID=59813 RepID=A0AAW5SKJ5_MYCNV|nr:NAD(P)/FAD-dependent oxidoreductase [Mycolicibacterium novocastrense]MCV7023739.1 NAD(P)/FAD-dependent oxidoreductase [Mycolicibacterium novocastrense]